MNPFKRFFNLFTADVAIDLGTANTLIYIPQRGIVLDEPSVVAVRQNAGTRSLAAVGEEAKKMLGRNPGNIAVVRPLKDGVIADLEVTEDLLKEFLGKVRIRGLFAPRVLVSVPCKSTSLERRAIREAVERAGAGQVRLIEEPKAAAIGAGLPVEQACGSMVVDIGGGTTEIAVVSLCSCVYAESLRVGGDLFDEHIVAHVRRTHGCLIGEATAERIKIEIGAACAGGERKEMEVRGRSLAAGVPQSFVINSDEVLEALADPVNSIVMAVKAALELTPAELSADIAERGMVLTGGGALLRDFDKLLSRETGLPVVTAEDPLTCVARGAGRALAHIDDPAYQMLYL